MRDVMDQLRSSGITTGDLAPSKAHASNTFAGQLDRFLARHRS